MNAKTPCDKACSDSEKGSGWREKNAGTSASSLKNIIFAVATAQFLLPFMVAGAGPLLPSIGRDLSASAMELSRITAL